MRDTSVRSNKLHPQFFRRDIDPHVPRAPQNDTFLIPVFGCGAGVAMWIARLRNFLVNQTIPLLSGKEMIVAVKDNRHLIADQ